jgi:hypothetical protein
MPVLLADLEIINDQFMRYYCYIPEFHRRKKLPIESHKLTYSIVFSSRSKPEHLERP